MSLDRSQHHISRNEENRSQPINNQGIENLNDSLSFFENGRLLAPSHLLHLMSERQGWAPSHTLAQSVNQWALWSYAVLGDNAIQVIRRLGTIASPDMVKISGEMLKRMYGSNEQQHSVICASIEEAIAHCRSGPGHGIGTYRLDTLNAALNILREPNGKDNLARLNRESVKLEVWDTSNIKIMEAVCENLNRVCKVLEPIFPELSTVLSPVRVYNLNSRGDRHVGAEATNYTILDLDTAIRGGSFLANVLVHEYAHSRGVGGGSIGKYLSEEIDYSIVNNGERRARVFGTWARLMYYLRDDLTRTIY